MSIIQNASIEDVTRLLGLFPIAQLKTVWDIAGKKDEICRTVASQTESRGQVEAFVADHFSCCKQHVYVFDRPEGTVPAFPPSIGSAVRVHEVVENLAIYVVRVVFNVVLSEPFERAETEFLWPFRVEVKPHYFVVRFVALEKNMETYFDRQFYGLKRSLDEEDLLSDVLSAYPFSLADLHKGVKSAWDDNVIDATRVRYKKPISTASEEMDEMRGVRAFSPTLYEALRNSVLFKTLFTITPNQDLSVACFAVKPAEGFLAFPQYSTVVGGTDDVIEEILARNQ